jgi:hypothetical protein
MATTELTPRRTTRLPLRRLGRTWLVNYAIVWLVTLTSASLVTVAGGALRGLVMDVLRLQLTPRTNPPPSVAGAFLLAAHNLPLQCWPVLLGAAGATRSPIARRLADAAVAALMLFNTVAVGAAIGAYGARLLPYITQLPFEWAGLALGISAWATQRQRPMTLRDGLGVYLLGAGVLLFSGLLETFAVPHR